MGRTTLVALVMGLCVTSTAHAELGFMRTSDPSGASGGRIVAVLSAPDDTGVTWIASETEVFVTDSRGEAWELVAQIRGNTRDEDQEEQEEDEDEDEDTFDEDASDEDDEDNEDDEDDEDRVGAAAETAPLGATRTARVTAAITRLHLMGDTVYWTGARGLWTIDRNARGLGTAARVRLGREMAVRDMAAAPWGPVLLATDQGLRQLDDGVGPVRGALADRDILVLVVSEGKLIAATADGLWRVDATGTTRMGVAGVRRASDLLALPSGVIAVATPSELILVDTKSEQVTRRWRVAGTERLAQDREGRLWAVGRDGAWSWTDVNSGADDADNWLPRTEGIGDQRMSAVAAPSAGPFYLWVVGRGGVHVRAPMRTILMRKRTGQSTVAYEESGISIDVLLKSAHENHFASHAYLQEMRSKGQWAFLLPYVVASYQRDINRNSELLDVPDLGQRLFTEVEVRPRDETFRVTVYWDFAPAIWSFFATDEGSSLAADGGSATAIIDSPGRFYTKGPTLAEETGRVQRTRAQIHQAVVGLYNLWGQQRRMWRSGSPKTPRDALKQILALQHTEADLHVLTHGKFVSVSTLDSILNGGNP